MSRGDLPACLPLLAAWWKKKKVSLLPLLPPPHLNSGSSSLWLTYKIGMGRWWWLHSCSRQRQVKISTVRTHPGQFGTRTSVCRSSVSAACQERLVMEHPLVYSLHCSAAPWLQDHEDALQLQDLFKVTWTTARSSFNISGYCSGKTETYPRLSPQDLSLTSQGSH